jgi:hypothetical protein
MSDWRYPEGNGWSKLGGNYTVRGDWINDDALTIERIAADVTEHHAAISRIAALRERATKYMAEVNW